MQMQVPDGCGLGLSRAEHRAFLKYCSDLECRNGCEVDYDAALVDWVQNHSASWRAQRHAIALEKQREEILKHKWIESEKAHHDVGKDAAADWIGKYAAQWREWFEQQDDTDDRR